MSTVTLWNSDRSGWAIFDREEDPVYRYQLGRMFEPDLFRTKLPVTFVMLNPSTATHLELDPTLRRCEDFAKRWGHTGFVVCNLFAFISPYPSVVIAAADPVGPENDAHLVKLRDMKVTIVVGWGAEPIAKRRVAAAVSLLGPDLFCLGTTSAGCPKHPLYLKADTQLQLWRMA